MYNERDPTHTKFIIDRINQAEKYLGSICLRFGKVCRKEARLRECNDEFVQNMFEFADRERINSSLRQSLQQYASYLSAVEDYRNTLILRIENQILEPLAKYGEVMKHTRQAVQKAIHARDKGAQQQRKLEQAATRNPNNREAIVAMQVSAEYAQSNAARADSNVQMEIDKFEQMKLTDIKKYLTDFTLINLSFHARAMEMYTYAHQQLLNINIEHDLEEFRTAAPFHRLHPSQRSASETNINDMRSKKTSALHGKYSGSEMVLTNRHHDEELESSRRSTQSDSRGARGATFEHDDRRSQPLRDSQDDSSPRGHAGKHDKTSSSSAKGKAAKKGELQSYSEGSSDSDDE